jgi:hypothetical protein
MHQPLGRILTPEDRATHAKWMRAVATFYGRAGLLLLWAAMALPSTSPDEPRRDAVWAEIERSLTRFNTPDGWIGPNELLLTNGRRSDVRDP